MERKMKVRESVRLKVSLDVTAIVTKFMDYSNRHQKSINYLNDTKGKGLEEEGV